MSPIVSPKRKSLFQRLLKLLSICAFLLKRSSSTRGHQIHAFRLRFSPLMTSTEQKNALLYLCVHLWLSLPIRQRQRAREMFGGRCHRGAVLHVWDREKKSAANTDRNWGLGWD